MIATAATTTATAAAGSTEHRHDDLAIMLKTLMFAARGLTMSDQTC